MSARDHADCGRRWQAEAREDGRLSGAELASFERHAAQCPICRQELRSLLRLRALGARLPEVARAPLERRRTRYELLRRAYGLTVEAPRTRRSRPVLLALSACALVALLALAATVWPSERRTPDPATAATRAATRPPVPAPVPAKVPSFQLEASSDARYATVERGQTLRLQLVRGSLTLTVDPLRPGQRFLLSLPDGELEVKGTRFIAHADGTRTRAVSVSEGKVALRLLGQPERLLRAGDAYRPAEPPPRVEPPRVATRVEASAQRPPAAPRAGPSRRARNEARVDSPRPHPDTTDAPGSGPMFAAAMAAFAAGDYGRSDTLLADFIRAHPHDGRAEDALFLRAVGLSRRGEHGRAATFARDYLVRYPNGLRRAEAIRLSHPHAP